MWPLVGICESHSGHRSAKACHQIAVGTEDSVGDTEVELVVSWGHKYPPLVPLETRLFPRPP